MSNRIAGNSLIAFGATSLVGSIVAAYLLDATTVDIAALIVMMLGAGVSGGNQRAIRWSFILAGYYSLLATGLLVVGIVWPERLQIGMRPIHAAERPWALLSFAAAAAWSAVNLGLLWRARRSTIDGE